MTIWCSKFLNFDKNQEKGSTQWQALIRINKDKVDSWLLIRESQENYSVLIPDFRIGTTVRVYKVQISYLIFWSKIE